MICSVPVDSFYLDDKTIDVDIGIECYDLGLVTGK